MLENAALGAKTGTESGRLWRRPTIEALYRGRACCVRGEGAKTRQYAPSVP